MFSRTNSITNFSPDALMNKKAVDHYDDLEFIEEGLTFGTQFDEDQRIASRVGSNDS